MSALARRFHIGSTIVQVTVLEHLPDLDSGGPRALFRVGRLPALVHLRPAIALERDDVVVGIDL